MEHTFKCDDCIVITIPLVKDDDNRQSENAPPEKFHCVFKDSYKIFLKGQPKALGTAQFFIGLLVVTLGLVQKYSVPTIAMYTIPSILFLASGILSYAAGHAPNICATKTSFSLNIISLFSALTLMSLVIIKSHASTNYGPTYETDKGIDVMTGILLFLEMVVAMVSIFWESKAICRSNFNTLPLINIKYV